MKRRLYTPPLVAFEKFIPNEYVAVCKTDSGTIYKFSCDAPAGTLYYASGYPASGEEPTSVGGRRDNTYSRLGSYHPCGTTHEAEDNNSFYWGYVDYNGNQQKDQGESVIVYVERNWLGLVNNGHATKNLSMSSWETKNHS